MARTPCGSDGEMSRRLAVPLLVFAFYAILFVIYAAGPERIYLQVMKGLGHPDAFPVLFIDAEAVLSWMDCARAGVDVFARNPCDPLGRVVVYSPIWLWMQALPVGIADTNAFGFLMFAILLLALYALPAPAGWGEVALRVACAMSSSIVFAVERANLDLILFGLLVAASALIGRSLRWRLAGYVLLLVAAALKFYPFTAMIVVARERLGTMVALCGIAVVAALVFALAYRPELLAIAPNIPKGQPFGDFFGARMLPDGLALLSPSKAGRIESTAILLVLTSASFAVAILLALSSRIGMALDALPADRLIALTIGAATIAGCFYAGANIPYRCVHLFLLLPGLVALATGRGAFVPRMVFGLALVFLLSALWSGTLVEVAGFTSALGASLPMLGAWLARQLAWWWLVTVMLGIAINRIFTGDAITQAIAWLPPALGRGRSA